jgi:hypothetical protein
MESCSDGVGEGASCERKSGDHLKDPEESEKSDSSKTEHPGPSVDEDKCALEATAAPIRRMGWQEKQVRRNSMLHRSHTMPVTRRRDSVTAEDEDICALRTRVLSKIAQERGNSPSQLTPGSPAPVKFSKSRRPSLDPASHIAPTAFDGFFDLSLSPSVLINQIPVVESRTISPAPVNVPVPEPSPRPDKSHGPPIASQRRRFSCSMPARSMSKVLHSRRSQPSTSSHPLACGAPADAVQFSRGG